MLDVHVKPAEPVPPEPVSPDLPATAPHDDGPPEALVAFMVTEWEPRNEPIEPLPEAARFRARRERLSARFPGDVLIVATGHEKTRANDTSYRFRAGTDFYYLTGNLEADCVLVMTPVPGGHRARMFVEPNPGKTDKSFFTDRVKGELWVGPRLGVPESSERYGLEAAPLGDLEEVLGAATASPGKVRVLRGIDAHVDRQVDANEEGDAEFASFLSELRLIKDDYELAELQRAVDATGRGFEDVLRALPRSATERHVEGVFNLRARVEGNDVGYSTIAAAGRHACTLHWTANDGPVRAGELLLLDAGVEATSLYTADITRTIPVSGRFGAEQREIYELVYAAQEAAFAACVPGNDFMAPNNAAMHVLAHGLERLGILPMPAEEALLATNMFYKRYSLHNVSHMLGLDVHDCAQARKETYKYGKLEPGMVLTVEPGLYLQPDDRTVPARYRGIGVRIEDDIVITHDGYRCLSDGIPRAPDDVERWVAECAGSAAML
jgi:Xaa-Pro aminopeptidase